MTLHQMELNALREKCEDEVALTKQVYSQSKERMRNSDIRRRRNNIADSICIMCIGIGIYFALYGLASFFQWCSTGTWI